jgi:hypothetical protein
MKTKRICITTIGVILKTNQSIIHASILRVLGRVARLGSALILSILIFGAEPRNAVP